MFQITMGVPEMEIFWTELKKKVRSDSATKKEQQLFKKLGKTMNHLAHDPGYPGLQSNRIQMTSQMPTLKSDYLC